MIIQSYSNIIMLYIVDNYKSTFLNDLERYIISLIFDYNIQKYNKEKTNEPSKFYLDVKINKKFENKKTDIENEFIEILLNRLKYKEPFINFPELQNWITKNQNDIIKYIKTFLKFNYL